MNSKLTQKTKHLLDSAIHRKTMKTPDLIPGDTKTKKKSQRESQFIRNNIYNYSNTRDTRDTQDTRDTRNSRYHSVSRGISKKTYTRRRTSRGDYITKLVELYYDNDKNVNQYLESAHKRSHIIPNSPNSRIIVIGDIHGDFDVAIKSLILAGCIKYIETPIHKTVESMDVFFKSLLWTGGSTYIVQLGDQIDRVRPQSWDRNSISRENAYEDEGSTLEIFYLFWHLNNLASSAGGRVFCILGNHEIMNIEGDFRYVSREEFRCFKEHLDHIYHPNSKYPYHSRTLKSARNILYPDGSSSSTSSRSKYKHPRLPIGYRERLYAFSPTGLCANFLARNYYSMLQIGKWLFCHGSPTMETVTAYPVDLLNTVTSMYLLGLDSRDMEIEKHFDKIMHDIPSQSSLKSKEGKNDNDDSTSIIWARTFGERNINNSNYEKKLEKNLDAILAAYNTGNHNTLDSNKAHYIAIGHTPQLNEGINSIINERVWRCDIGMSKAFLNNKDDSTNAITRKIQVLEIINNKARILTN